MIHTKCSFPLIFFPSTPQISKDSVCSCTQVTRQNFESGQVFENSQRANTLCLITEEPVTQLPLLFCSVALFN